MVDLSVMMPKFVEYIKQYIPNPKIIVDLGSMDGKDSLYLKECFPESVVYSIEGLEENYNLFKDSTQIVPIHAVVCNIDGEVEFHKKDINGIHGIYDRGKGYGEEKFNTPCCKFKTLVENVIKESVVDILKIDVEGATYDVLLGMGDFIHSVGMMHIETETVELFAGQVVEKVVFDYLVFRDFKMLDRKCCNIKSNAQQCDSVWINRRMYGDRLVSK